MRIKRLFILLIVISFISITVEAQIQARIKFGEIPNLTYQLDCVGDLPINCSRQNLGDLWTREFLKTDEDRRMLKEWARLRDFYSKDVQLSKETDADYSSISIFNKIRIAGFQANGVDDYLARLDLLTVPADRASFERVVRYFEPRFKIWWQAEATKSGDEFAKKTETLLRSPKIAEPIRQFYNFYQPVLPKDYEISFNLFYIPASVKEASSGQQLENYSLMEFKSGETPEQRVDIAVHELCHFFYANTKPEIRARMQAKFQESNRAAAVPAFNLLNESLAAAFGNGMIARAVTPAAEFDKYLAAKKSFYNNSSIDRAAKAILPMLDERLKNNRTIDDESFVNDYISTLEKAFGADLLTPKLYLSEQFLFIDNKYAVSMRRDVRRTLEAASFYSSEGSLTDANVLDDFKNHPRLNSLFIVHPDNLAELAKNKIITDAQLKAIQNEYAAKQSILFGTTRAKFTYVYIIAAKDADGAKKLIEKLANAKQFEGIYKEGIQK